MRVIGNAEVRRGKAEGTQRKDVFELSFDTVPMGTKFRQSTFLCVPSAFPLRTSAFPITLMRTPVAPFRANR